MSQAAFGWVVTALTGGVAGVWGVVDVIRLRRALREDRRQPVVRDRIFGSVIGLAISALGVTGAILYHL